MNAVFQSPAQALPLAAWLDVLSTVFPPRGVVVVGAGTGNGPWVQWLRSRRLNKVWLIEGDEAQYRHLLRHLPQGCGWTPRLDVVAEAPTSAVFYRASNPAESGLIAPGHLRTLWPHLAEAAATEIQTPATLDTVLAEAGNEVNWLVLDCLPAGRLLRGGASRLDQLELIAVRVGSEQPASGLDKESLHHTVDALLVSAGFVCVHTCGERHPALAHALYVRSPAVQQQRIGQAEQLATEHTQALEGAQAALTTLQQERDTLAARLQQLESEVAALALARDEQAKLRQEAQQLAAERSGEIEALKADMTQRIQALQAQLLRLEQDKADLAAQGAQAQALAEERTQALEGAQAALTTLQQERDTLAARLQQLESEVAALALARDEQAKLRQEAQQLAAERSGEIEALKADMTQRIQALQAQLLRLEQDKADLAAQGAQAQALAEERTQALEAAQAALTTLQQERDTLAARLQQLESEVAALALARDEQAKLRQEAQQLAAERSGEIEALKADLDKKIRTQEAETPGLFSLSCYFDGHLVALRMNTTHPEWVQIDGDTVSYSAQSGAPLYLLAKEDGDFNLPPKQPQLLVEPGISYELSGRLAHLGDHRPQLWLFQYDGAKKLDSRSIAVDEAGRFRLEFQTLPATRCVVIGLRFAGQGRLHRADTYLRLKEQTGAVSTQNVEQRLQYFEKLQRREMENAVRQIESFIRLQHYLGPDTLVPEVHHWPVSPDFGVLLIELVEAYDYDAVIEFGSGTSTLILAKAQQRVARKKRRRPSPLLSFDHLEQYQRKSQRSLEQAGVAAHARVELAPLLPWRRGDGVEFSYYACDAALCALSQDIDTAGAHLLVVVDGPPAKTGPLARYPALPKVLEALGTTRHFHFLMDDYLRPDEQEVVKAWEAHAAQVGLDCTRTEFQQLEKKACLLEVHPVQQDAQKSKNPSGRRKR